MHIHNVVNDNFWLWFLAAWSVETKETRRNQTLPAELERWQQLASAGAGIIRSSDHQRSATAPTLLNERPSYS